MVHLRGEGHGVARLFGGCTPFGRFEKRQFKGTVAILGSLFLNKPMSVFSIWFPFQQCRVGAPKRNNHSQGVVKEIVRFPFGSCCNSLFCLFKGDTNQGLRILTETRTQTLAADLVTVFLAQNEVSLHRTPSSPWHLRRRFDLAEDELLRQSGFF